MTTVLIFLIIVSSVSIWWLSKQRLTSKPWLQSGLEISDMHADQIRSSKPKVGLIVFLAIIGMLFALLISGNFMRQEVADWRQVPLPNILWITTELLILSSLFLHFALVAARKNDVSLFLKKLPQSSSEFSNIEMIKPSVKRAVKIRLRLAAFTSLAFLAGQMMAWKELSNSGFQLTGNPANSFFYLLTGIHGLHILGGLVALGRTMLGSWLQITREKLIARIELCAFYWHFLLVVWFVLLVVMLGWAHDPFISSHH
jgi:cytochrome c oxidase subunit 3